MLRLLAVTAIELAANAIGLLLAAWILPGFSLTPLGFLVVVGIFTVTRIILAPLFLQVSLKHVRALSGGVALVVTFVGLLVTTLITNGLVIRGIDTWVLATLIVWLGGVLASLILPLFLFKKLLAR